ncbi:glycoside hydrolase family 16 protein [Carboxylicivirga linearis]|uniref:Glycoside hydrolase family 16 protein n=1 Tax=Carboxylicivirga linearis TaxID=1628157 RepID=A0ABS5K1U6_9BACT|nr:glycoside hydrolase family 16 protein [Carboxylicivirga linearis]MBS2100511.1 glycoside hydrolase family 16 protein [Carboxylicivirga linearis]
MASFLNSLFGSKYPQTAKYEAEQEKLKSDYQRLIDFENSSNYNRFKELDTLVHSGDFIKKVEQLKSEKFKDTPEYRKLKDFESLRKSSDLKKYFKYKASHNPERINSIAQSDILKQYSEIKKWIDSAEFREAKSKKDYKKSEAYTKFKEFKSLQKDSDIKFYYKETNKAIYKNFINIDNSERLATFESLKEEVESADFIAFKKDLEDPKRFAKSKEHALISEYEDIKKTPEFKWFEKIKNKDLFKEIDKWQVTFEDDFDSAQIDQNKWINGYYWGKALLNDVYVLKDEKQFFSDSNIQLRDSVAHLTTKEGKIKGKVWDDKLGFVPKEFNFSSALISTGQSFRQLYGKFEAKVKVNDSSPLNHAFWMVGESIAPQIDIFRFAEGGAKNFKAGSHTIDNSNNALHNVTTVNGVKFDSDYYIYGLEWSKDKLTWTVNGVTVHEQTKNIPQHPMYLVFSSHLLKDVEKINLPSALSVDWIRCYQQRA